MTATRPASAGAQPPASAAGDVRAALARGPCAFPTLVGDCPAFLHRADGDVGVVLCGGWGYEELCTRRALGELAEGLAAAGYPTVRFDYPGCGGAPGDLEATKLDDWLAAIGRAAEMLRGATGAQRIVLAGYGVGALLAVEAARRGLACAGALLLAMPASGRRYIRELRVWAGQVAAAGDGSEALPEGAAGIAGFVLPAPLVRDISALDPGAFALPADGFGLVVSAQGGVPGARAGALAAQGARVETLGFDGFEELVAGPTMSRTPVETFARAIERFSALAPVRPAPAPAAPPPPAQRVEGPAFGETGLRFGPGNRLFGVVCRPRGACVGAVALLNVGRNPLGGWRRMGVEQARALAARGVASLRFDLGGIGESASAPGQPETIVYHDWPKRDVAAALDLMSALDLGPVTLVGVCSGAYLGLRYAVDDARIAGLVCINLYRMVWDPDETVEHALRFANRPIGEAVARFLTWEKVVDVARGRADPWPGLRHLLKKAKRRVGVATMAWLGPLSPRHALYAQCMRQFEILSARGAPIALGYSAGDDGLTDLADYFGRDYRRLSVFPDVRMAILDGCDHNLTPPKAAEWLLAQITATVARAGVNAQSGLRARM